MTHSDFKCQIYDWVYTLIKYKIVILIHLSLSCCQAIRILIQERLSQEAIAKASQNKEVLYAEDACSLYQAQSKQQRSRFSDLNALFPGYPSSFRQAHLGFRHWRWVLLFVMWKYRKCKMMTEYLFGFFKRGWCQSGVPKLLGHVKSKHMYPVKLHRPKSKIRFNLRCNSERSSPDPPTAAHRGAEGAPDEDQWGHRRRSGHHRWPQDRPQAGQGRQMRVRMKRGMLEEGKTDWTTGVLIWFWEEKHLNWTWMSLYFFLLCTRSDCSDWEFSECWGNANLSHVVFHFWYTCFDKYPSKHITIVEEFKKEFLLRLWFKPSVTSRNQRSCRNIQTDGYIFVSYRENFLCRWRRTLFWNGLHWRCVEKYKYSWTEFVFCASCVVSVWW